MERVLLLASLIVGVVMFLLRFLPVSRGGVSTGGTEPSAPPLAHPALCMTALVTPFLGLLLTLPAHGAFFSAGQRLGLGFLIGGVATLLSHIPLLWQSKRAEPPAPIALASAYGMGIAAVAVALLALRASLFDGLMGVAIGGFCVAFALLLGLPRQARAGAAGRRLAASTGFLVTLAAAVSLAVFRDPLTPELAKLTWSAVLVAFAAFGTLLVAGATLLPTTGAGQWGRLVPLAVLIGGGGLALYELVSKLTGTTELALIGVGGLLLWPVALAVLRETARRNEHAVPNSTPVLGVPLLAVLVVASGFLAALQTLQGTGVAVGTLALYLALPATFALMPRARRR